MSMTVLLFAHGTDNIYGVYRIGALFHAGKFRKPVGCDRVTNRWLSCARRANSLLNAPLCRRQLPY